MLFNVCGPGITMLWGPECVCTVTLCRLVFLIWHKFNFKVILRLGLGFLLFFLNGGKRVELWVISSLNIVGLVSVSVFQISSVWKVFGESSLTHRGFWRRVWRGLLPQQKWIHDEEKTSFLLFPNVFTAEINQGENLSYIQELHLSQLKKTEVW